MSLALAGPASAHTLSKGRAEARAAIEASDFADVGEYYAWQCPTRLSSHARRCIIASYDPETDVTCDAYVNVRFRNRRSYRTVAGARYEVECEDGNPYGLGPA